MTATDWLWHSLMIGIDWLMPIAYATGLVISVWAYRRSRKRGYITIAMFFSLAVYACTLAPQVSRAIQQHFWPQPEITDVQTDAFNHELDKLYEKYYPRPEIQMTRRVSFPLGPILLVTGLWFVTRKETEYEIANQSSDPT